MTRREWMARTLGVGAGMLTASTLRGQKPEAVASPADAVALAAADLRKLPADERIYARYFWLNEAAGKDRKLAWEVLAGQVNALSRAPRIVAPVVILNAGQVRKGKDMPDEAWPNATLLRVRYDDYHWNPKVLDRLAEQDFLFHTTLVEEWPGGFDARFGRDYPKGRYRVRVFAPWLAETAAQLGELRYLAETTRSQTPILHAGNFYWQTSIQSDRVVGYNGMLGVKNRKDFFALAGFHEEDLKERPELLAVAALSEISKQPRRIGRFPSADGAVWRTFDNSLAIERRNPIIFLNKGFNFAGEESFLRLPNGMWATGLFQGNVDKDGKPNPKDGDNVDSAPDFIGFNHGALGNNGKIEHNTCFACHDSKADKGGLADVDDWFRNFGDAGKELKAKDYDTYVALRDKYSQDLKKALARDRRAYIDALAEANGLDPQTHAAQMAAYFQMYDGPVGVDRAGRDVGCTADVLSAAVDGYSRGEKSRQYQNLVVGVYGLPAEKRKPIPIDQYHESLNLLHLQRRGLIQWSPEIRGRILK